jgi:serine/threonine-protein kinase RsbW
MRHDADRAEKLKIVARPEQLARVRRHLEHRAAGIGFDEHAQGQIVLAIDEALTNVIRHGYGGACDQPIEINISPIEHGPHGAGIEVVIRDHGKQVDPKRIKSRSLEEIRPGGLGVHIITTVMDEAEYSCPADGGMQLRVRKYVRKSKG